MEDVKKTIVIPAELYSRCESVLSDPANELDFSKLTRTALRYYLAEHVQQTNKPEAEVAQ